MPDLDVTTWRDLDCDQYFVIVKKVPQLSSTFELLLTMTVHDREGLSTNTNANDDLTLM